jgi:hypothetical protein
MRRAFELFDPTGAWRCWQDEVSTGSGSHRVLNLAPVQSGGTLTRSLLSLCQNSGRAISKRILTQRAQRSSQSAQRSTLLCVPLRKPQRPLGLKNGYLRRTSEVLTQTLLLPVLTSLRDYISPNRAPGNRHDMMPRFVNLKPKDRVKPSALFRSCASARAKRSSAPRRSV